MKLPWFWITGTAVTAIGAIATGLIYPSATPPLGSRAIIAEMDPWEVFIRTEGRQITEQIEQIGLEIESLRGNLNQVKNRVPKKMSNSPEMREWQMRLESMEEAKKQSEDRRHRMFLRWSLGEVENFEGEITGAEFLTFVDSQTSTDEPEIDRSTFKLFSPPAQKLAEIQNEVFKMQQKEQGFFQKTFGQRFSEPQMARYVVIYRHFQSKGVRNPSVLLTLTSFYSVFIIGGQRFDVNLGMTPNVHRHCPSLPSKQALQGIQLAIGKDVQKEKNFLGGRYDMLVTRYSKMRLTRVLSFSTSAGASEDQANLIANDFKNFINTGALPQN
tara:strand:- start:544 stop:1527 length:984 start_codon:yes stop_codon:yes gene_type:complete